MTCKHLRTKVINSRPADYYKHAKGYKNVDLPKSPIRRRECKDCGKRFTTLEVRIDTLSMLATTSKEMRKLLVGEISEFLENKGKQ